MEVRTSKQKSLIKMQNLEVIAELRRILYTKNLHFRCNERKLLNTDGMIGRKSPEISRVAAIVYKCGTHFIYHTQHRAGPCRAGHILRINE